MGGSARTPLSGGGLVSGFHESFASFGGVQWAGGMGGWVGGREGFVFEVINWVIEVVWLGLSRNIIY